MLMPIVDMSHDDRGRMICIEKHFDQFHNRLGKIEEAVFNKALNGEDTIFDKLKKRIQQNEAFMKIELENVKNWRENKYRELDAVVFESNQKIKACLSVKEELLRLESEQKRLQDFLNKYNAGTIDDIQKVRELIAETTATLQKQLTNHWRKIDAYKPRLEELEF